MNEQGHMRIIDADAHFHEPKDWLKAIDPKLDEEIGPAMHFREAAKTFFYPNPRVAELPEGERPPENEDVLPEGFAEHLDLTEERHPDTQEESKDGPLFSAEGRLKFCDENGIDVQILNPTFLRTHVVSAAIRGKIALAPKIKTAWNTWAVEQVSGHTDRLLPTVQLDFNDVPGTVAEMTRMRKLGCRNFGVDDSIVGGNAVDGEIGRSLTHPDFDPIWSAATDLEMTPILHVGLSREQVNPGWARNGQRNMLTYGLLNFSLAPQLGIQSTLAALVLDGMFERFPKLVWMVQECGIGWLPNLLEVLDETTELPELPDGIYRPAKLASSYKLPLKPSEYFARHVRVSPLITNQPLRPTMDLIPSEIVCFASDYPHVEGTADAVELSKSQISDLSSDVQRNFFGGVGELMGI